MEKTNNMQVELYTLGSPTQGVLDENQHTPHCTVLTCDLLQDRPVGVPWLDTDLDSNADWETRCNGTLIHISAGAMHTIMDTLALPEKEYVQKVTFDLDAPTLRVHSREYGDFLLPVAEIADAYSNEGYTLSNAHEGHTLSNAQGDGVWVIPTPHHDTAMDFFWAYRTLWAFGLAPTPLAGDIHKHTLVGRGDTRTDTASCVVLSDRLVARIHPATVNYK